MKDCDGRYLHIDDEVTFNEKAPRILIGDHSIQV